MTTRFLKLELENEHQKDGEPFVLTYINTNDVTKIEAYCYDECEKEYAKIYLKNGEIVTTKMYDDLFEQINSLSYEDNFKFREDLIEAIKKIGY